MEKLKGAGVVVVDDFDYAPETIQHIDIDSVPAPEPIKLSEHELIIKTFRRCEDIMKKPENIEAVKAWYLCKYLIDNDDCIYLGLDTSFDTLCLSRPDDDNNFSCISNFESHFAEREDFNKFYGNFELDLFHSIYLLEGPFDD